jgi:hypothetical protein
MADGDRVGFFYDEPAEKYHVKTLGEANNGGLKILRDRSPAHYKAWIEGVETKTTEAMKLGRIIHTAILEPDKLESEYLVLPDFGPLQSSRNRADRDAWLAAQSPTAIVVKPGQIETARTMREAVLRHKTARLLIERGKPEVTMRWRCPRTGVMCRARMDWYYEEMEFAMDLKSTDDASPGAFSRSIANFDYHVQHCFYSDGVTSLDKPIKNYLICAAEKEAPNAVGVYHIDAAAEERGFEILNRSMDTLAKCNASGAYPAYGEDIGTLTLPGWAFWDR